MPDETRDVTKFTKYFNIPFPSSTAIASLIIIMGALTGIISSLLAHVSADSNPAAFAVSGVSYGIFMLSIPAILTAAVTKALKSKLRLRHALVATLVITINYGIFLMVDSLVFALTSSAAIAYIILILVNAGIYEYWFIIDKVVMHHKRINVLYAAIQPVLNILFYIPVSRYMLDLSVPVESTMIKLWAGMLVFMVFGYIILYVMDRPAKKILRTSGVEIISSMVNQWLYNVIQEVKVYGNPESKRDVNVKVLALKGKEGYKAIFVQPDIHYGPYQYMGGSIATEYIGRSLSYRYKAVPFVLHGAVSIEDNPISTSQIYAMEKRIEKHIDGLSDHAFREAKGSIAIGEDKPCKAISIRIEDMKMLTLTKAPSITEDIDREVGRRLSGLAGDPSRVMLVDAHNSRYESASKDELRGIQDGSVYISKYENAIAKAISAGKQARSMKFGAAGTNLNYIVGKRDIGSGFTGVAVFEFGGRRFCLVNFDANNMLPGFREQVLKRIKERYKMDAEVCTTDTHAVNSIALSASNVLGRRTRFSEVSKQIDNMIDKALAEMESVSYVYENLVMSNFNVWGKGSGEAIVKATRDIIRTGKRIVPFLIAAGFIVAAWIIYIT